MDVPTPPHFPTFPLSPNMERNAIHGSDAPETAAVEPAFFFPQLDRLR